MSLQQLHSSSSLPPLIQGHFLWLHLVLHLHLLNLGGSAQLDKQQLILSCFHAAMQNAVQLSMGLLSKRLCFFLCVAESMYNEMNRANDFARIVMSSGQLGLFLKCLFNPFSCLQAKSLQTISYADGLTWIFLSILI